jgi:hypothetical protein
MEIQKENIVEGLERYIESEAITDKVDLKYLKEALKFLKEQSTEDDVEKIIPHTRRIGTVLSGYSMTGEEFPPEIDRLHAHLLTLQCISRRNFVGNELKKPSPDFDAIQKALTMALDTATALSRGYKEETQLAAIQGLNVTVEQRKTQGKIEDTLG